MTSFRWGHYLPTWLRGTRGILVGVAALGIGGAAIGWPWLLAVGIAPILLSTLPCLAMCALGLCAMGKSCSKSNASQDAKTDTAVSTSAPTLLAAESEPMPPPQPVREPERTTVS
jgi:hypothetical protein